MTTRQRHKKPTTDWHRADIVAALRKAGWSLRRLATHHGYSAPTTLTNALARPWPRGERIIAAAIGVDPATIWPSRYAVRTAYRYAKDTGANGVATDGLRQGESEGDADVA